MAKKFRDLYDWLNHEGLLKYGTHIKGEKIRDYLEIHLPEKCTVKEFKEAGLLEMSAVDYVRNILLGQGMYLQGVGEDYRILLPSENSRQVELYMSSADRKLSRALKLSRNSPKEQGERPSQQEARAMMKQQGVRRKMQEAPAS